MAGIAKEGKNCREASYPVDFIAESLDQTRGWFYTLNAIYFYFERSSSMQKKLFCYQWFLFCKTHEVQKYLFGYLSN